MFLADAPPNLLLPHLLPFATSIVVALVFIGVFAKFVWPQIAKGLDDRNQKILSEIAAAEAARAQAKAAQSEFERKLIDAQDHATRVIREAQAVAAQQGEEMRARIELELNERQRRAAEEIEAARRAAVASLQEQTADLAIAVAGRILGREINAADQRRLVDESVRELALKN